MSQDSLAKLLHHTRVQLGDPGDEALSVIEYLTKVINEQSQPMRYTATDPDPTPPTQIDPTQATQGDTPMAQPVPGLGS